MSGPHITIDDSHAPTPLITAWWALHGAGDRDQMTSGGVFDAAAATLHGIATTSDPATRDAYAADLANEALMAELVLAMAEPTVPTVPPTIVSEAVPVVEAVPVPPVVSEPVTLEHLQPAVLTAPQPVSGPAEGNVELPAAHASFLLTLEHDAEGLWAAVKRLFGHL